MNGMSVRKALKWLCCLAVMWSAVATQGKESVRQPRLAVIITGEHQDAEFEVLQTLIEADLFRTWAGELLERKELGTILNEQVLNRIRGDESLDLGRLLNVDFLLLVRLQTSDTAIKQVHCTINSFPDTAVVAQFSLNRDAALPSLAKRITVRASRAIGQHKREQNNLYVSIGNFLYDDPFSRYEKVSDDLHRRLRGKLRSHRRLVLAERMFPSQLLTEFQLTRSGLTNLVEVNLNAAPSDLLIIGEFKPAQVQPIVGKDIQLEFQLRLISPTGLFVSVQKKSTVDGTDIEKVASWIETVVTRLVDLLPTKLTREVPQTSSHEEFQTLKQQAFRLLPDSPKEDLNFHSNGSYRGSRQFGKTHVLRQALRGMENAMLFCGDDTQLMVGAGVTLHGLSRNQSRGEKNGQARTEIFSAGFDYLETALLLESNENTRGVCYETVCNPVSWKLLPKRTAALAERMVHQGADGGWFPHHIKWAKIYLSRHTDNPDDNVHLDEKINLFRREATSKHIELDTLFSLYTTIDVFFMKNRSNESIVLRSTAFAEELIAAESTFLQALGHYLRSRLYFYAANKDVRCLSHIRQLVELIPAMHRECGQEFIDTSLSYCIYGILREYKMVVQHYQLKDDTLDLYEAYTVHQVAIGNFHSSSIEYCIGELLPYLHSEGRSDVALRLVFRLLEHYNTGGSADFNRMSLARWHNHLRQTTNPQPQIKLSRLTQIELPEGEANTRIKKILHARGQIWSLRCDRYLQDRIGEVFVMPIDAIRAERVQQVKGVATDIAASDNLIAVSTIDRGLYLFDERAIESSHFEPEASSLPSQMVRTVASDGAIFYLGMPGKGYYHVYTLDPEAGTVRDTESKLSYHAYYQTMYDPKAGRLKVQTWKERTFVGGGQRLHLKREPFGFYSKPRRLAVHKSTVSTDKGETLFEFTGFDLNHVYDFVLWRKHLVFATGNGLYVAAPMSNQLRCVMNDLELEVYSLCPASDGLFIGTNRGLHRLSAALFDEIIDASVHR